MPTKISTKANSSTECPKDQGNTYGKMDLPSREISNKAKETAMESGMPITEKSRATKGTILWIKSQAMASTSGTMAGPIKATSKTTSETAMDNCMITNKNYIIAASGKMGNKPKSKLSFHTNRKISISEVCKWVDNLLKNHSGNN